MAVTATTAVMVITALAVSVGQATAAITAIIAERGPAELPMPASAAVTAVTVVTALTAVSVPSVEKAR